MTRATLDPKQATLQRLLCGVVVSLLVVGAVGVPVTAASTTASVVAAPDDPGVTATHTATAVVGSKSDGDSLNGFAVDYSVSSSPADVSNVGQNDVVRVGLDTDGDGTIDTDVSNDLGSVSASNNGHTVNFGFGGSYSLAQGDHIIVEYENAVNPDSNGTFDVNLSINPQSTGDAYTTGLSINATAAAASVAADPNTDGDAATHAVTRTVGTANHATSLTTLEVNYSTATHPADVSNVTVGDVTTAALDADGDGTYETDLSGNLTGVRTVDGGETAVFDFDGSRTLDSGDEIRLVFGSVTNPAVRGDYPVAVRLNTSSSAPPTATLSIVDAGGTGDATVTAAPTDAGASATHTAVAVVGPDSVGDSLNGFTVDYSVSSSSADVSNVGQDDVVRVGIDTDGDGTIDTDVSDDLGEASVSNNGHTVKFGFGGSYSLAENDTVVVEYNDTVNPDSAGTFDVNVTINPQSAGTPSTAGLEITSGSTPTPTPTPTPDDPDSGGESEPEPTQPNVELVTLPETASASATHQLRLHVGSANAGEPIEGVVVGYEQADLRAVSFSNVSVGVDADRDGDVDTSLDDRVESVGVNSDGTIRVGFDGAYTPDRDDVLQFVFEGVVNPPAGDHEVSVVATLGSTNLTVTDNFSTTESSPETGDAIRQGFLVASPPAAEADATHTAYAVADTGVSVTQVTVSYPAAIDAGGLNQSDLTTLGVDTNGDGAVDSNLTAAVESVETDANAVTVTLADRQRLRAGEMFVVGFESVRNPSLGTYATAIRFDDRPAERATLVVGEPTAEVFEFESNNESRKLVRASPAGSANVSLDAVGSSDVELQQLSIAFGNASSSVVVGSGGDVPTPAGVRGQELGELTLQHSEGNVAGVTVEFTVAKSRLAETQYGPRNVSLYYRQDGDWRREETELVGETATAYQYRVEAAALSSYSVWAGPPRPDRRPDIQIREVALNRSEVEPGTPVRVSVAARNVGNVSGRQTITASINGVVVEQSTVSLAAGGSTTVAFAHTFDRPGRYDLTITGTPSTRPTTPGFGVPVALVAAAVVLLQQSTTGEDTEDNP
ncbi:hypothetical protein BRD04_08965 [Halobacteriales archaeon QS_9_67_17]|nr:MAG: hypothetical protein BRD04_08965 [Halobacteriales archaeon QS_9_67_17]